MKCDVPFKEIKFKRKVKKYFLHDFSRPRFSEVDSYNVLWNGHYVNYFEHARLELCRHVGFSLEKLSELGCLLPVYKFSVTVRKPVLAHEEIVVGVTAKELSSSSILFEHILMVDGEVRAYGEIQHIPTDKNSGKMLFTLSKEVTSLLLPMTEIFDIDSIV